MGKVLADFVIRVANVASLPGDNTANTEGRLAFAVAEEELYRDDGEDWELIADIGGGGGGGGGNIITTGVYADSRPATPANGDMFIAKDGRFTEIYHDTKWNRYLGGQLMSDPPALGSFTEINMAPATFTEEKGELLLAAPPASGTNVHAALVSASAPYKLTVLIEVEMIIVNGYTMGLCLRNSGSDEIIGGGPGGTGGAGFFRYMLYNDETTFDSEDSCWTQQAYPSHRIWLEVENDTTNRRWRWSATNGETWFDMHGEGPTDFTTEDQVGVFVDTDNPDVGARLRVLSWKLT